jgi:LysM repeat protein
MFDSSLDVEHSFVDDTSMTRTRVRRRRVGLLLVSLAVGVGAAVVTSSPEQPAAISVAHHGYVVKAGDTLWSIAERVGSEGDPRPMVDAIAASNGVDPGELIPGQTLLIPAGV